jgi:hypothetical protein
MNNRIIAEWAGEPVGGPAESYCQDDYCSDCLNNIACNVMLKDWEDCEDKVTA